MDKSKFLGSSNVRLVKQLFIENDWIGTNDLAVYSLSRKDKEVAGKSYPSLYRLYMETGDITEARFVDLYLYDVEQWKRIAASSLLKDEVGKWREELKLRVLGSLVDSLVVDARSGSKSSTSSAKYLIDRFSKEPKGRPSNKAMDTSSSVSLKLAEDFEEDLKRVRVN